MVLIVVLLLPIVARQPRRGRVHLILSQILVVLETLDLTQRLGLLFAAQVTATTNDDANEDGQEDQDDAGQHHHEPGFHDKSLLELVVVHVSLHILVLDQVWIHPEGSWRREGSGANLGKGTGSDSVALVHSQVGQDEPGGSGVECDIGVKS